MKRIEYCAHEYVGTVPQHRPRETEDPPPFGHERILSPAIGLEQFLVRLVQPAVDLDRQFLLSERDVDVEQFAVDLDWQIGPPARNPSCPEQPVTQPFRSRPWLVT